MTTLGCPFQFLSFVAIANAGNSIEISTRAQKMYKGLSTHLARFDVPRKLYQNILIQMSALCFVATFDNQIGHPKVQIRIALSLLLFPRA